MFKSQCKFLTVLAVSQNQKVVKGDTTWILEFHGPLSTRSYSNKQHLDCNVSFLSEQVKRQLPFPHSDDVITAP